VSSKPRAQISPYSVCMLPVAGRGRRGIGLCYRVRGKAVAKQLTTEFYTVVLPLTFVLIIISIPLPLILSFKA